MDKEETHNDVRREASAAGLVAGLFILILIGIVAATVIMHFPAIHLSSLRHHLRRCLRLVESKALSHRRPTIFIAATRSYRHRPQTNSAIMTTTMAKASP